jgi:hypothetical protein
MTSHQLAVQVRCLAQISIRCCFHTYSGGHAVHGVHILQEATNPNRWKSRGLFPFHSALSVAIVLLKCSSILFQYFKLNIGQGHRPWRCRA